MATGDATGQQPPFLSLEDYKDYEIRMDRAQSLGDWAEYGRLIKEQLRSCELRSHMVGLVEMQRRNADEIAYANRSKGIKDTKTLRNVRGFRRLGLGILGFFWRSE
jgi:hypothetical protein